MTILIVLCSIVFPMIAGMVIVLFSPDVTVGAYVVCSDKMLLNVVLKLYPRDGTMMISFKLGRKCRPLHLICSASMKSILSITGRFYLMVKYSVNYMHSLSE